MSAAVYWPRHRRDPRETGGRTWGDPTGQEAVRQVALEQAGISPAKLQEVEEFVHLNPCGVRKVARSLGMARLHAEVAVDVLHATGRIRLAGGLYA